MAKKIIYKGITFDDFSLYKEALNSSGCEYKYPNDVITLEGFEEVDVYICPHCVKKYNLYDEAETHEDVVDKYISGEYDDGDMSMTCGIEGCLNNNAFDSWLSINKCVLK